MADEFEDLGADAAGTGPYVTVHVKDVPAVVRAKGGAAGALLANLAPKTIEAQVYGGLRDKLEEALKKEGVDADVGVVAARPPGPTRFPREILLGAGLGVAGVGAGWAFWRLVIRRFFFKKGR